MNKNRLIIAVDGPAGSGKSSISKIIANRLGLKYIDSGAVYRSITWYLLKEYGSIDNKLDITNDLQLIFLAQTFNLDGSCSTYINGQDVSEEIRDEIIAKNIGIVSDNTGVRDFVNTILRKWASENSVIMDGRDIGTVVFPNADIKFYLDASVDVRAYRRAKEYHEKGKNLDIKDIKKQIALRDEQDMSRPFGKLVRADDSIYIDTSDMSIEEVIHHVVNLVNNQTPVR